MEAAPKDSVNPFFKSKYTDYSSTVATVKPPLNNNGITYKHVSKFEESLYFVGTKLTHAESGQSPEPFYVPVKIGTSQETGSGITYAERYSLKAACGLASGEDDDGNEASHKKVVPPKPEPYLYEATNPQKIILASEADKAGISAKDKGALSALSEFLIKARVPMAKLREGIDEYMKNI